jgi:hypothetical protein
MWTNKGSEDTAELRGSQHVNLCLRISALEVSHNVKTCCIKNINITETVVAISTGSPNEIHLTF